MRLLLSIWLLALLAGSLSAESVYIQCLKNITNFFPENIDYCSISLDKLSCFDKIYQSNDTTDLMMMRKMNMRNFKANYLYLCSYNDFIKEKLDCFEAAEKMQLACMKILKTAV